MQNSYELITLGYCVRKQGRARAVRVLGSPLFKSIFAGKNELGTFFFPPVLNFVSQKSEARIVRAGGREFE